MSSILKVENKKELKRFIDFPHELYQDDPNYVPELYLSQKELLNKRKHPFFQHSKADFFLAIDINKIVGRIAAIRNNNYIKFTGNNIGFFGFFEVVDNFEIASNLLDTAINWIKNEELEGVIGPENYATAKLD